MKRFLTRLLIVLGLVAGLAPTQAALLAPAATASASNCEWAPGGSLARHCLHVNGTGTYVNWAKESYTTNWGGTNICNYAAKWNAWKQGTAGYVMKYSTVTTSCNVLVASKTTYQHTGYFTHGSRFCGWWRSDNTGGRWTSSNCITIKR